MPARLARVATILTICTGLASCAVTSADGRRLRPGSEAFGDYVEAVFRRQNAIASELTDALEEADPDGTHYETLEAAELDLLTACRGLNQLATRRRNGESMGGLGALKRARQAPECERAAERVAALL